MYTKFCSRSQLLTVLFCFISMGGAVNSAQAQENLTPDASVSQHSISDFTEIQKRLAVILAPAHRSDDADQKVIEDLNSLSLPAEKGVPFYRSLLKRYNDYVDTFKSNSEPVNYNIIYVAYMAIDKLEGYGIKATPAVGELVRIARESAYRKQTIKALNNIAPGNALAIPLLIKSLRDEDLEIVRMASVGLACGKPKAVAAVPVLVQLVHEGGDKSCYAYYALGEIVRNKYPLSIPEAVKSLKEIEKQPMGRGAVAIMVVGEAARNNTNALASLLSFMSRSKRDYQRYAAVQVLKDNGLVTKPECVTALLNQVRDETDDDSDIIPQTASEVLSGCLNANTKAAIVPLNRALQQPGRRRRSAAALALSRMGAPAVGALPNLILAFQQELAVPVAGGLDFSFSTMLSQSSKLRQLSPELESYILVFQRLGPLAKPAAPAIINTLKFIAKYPTDSDAMPSIRSKMLDVLFAIGLPTEPKDRQIILRETIVALKSKQVAEVASAAKIAERMPESASVTVPLLLKFLKLGEKSGLLDTPEEQIARNNRRRTLDSVDSEDVVLNFTSPYLTYSFVYSIQALGVLGRVDNNGKELITRYANVAPKPNTLIDYVRLEAQATLKKLN